MATITAVISFIVQAQELYYKTIFVRNEILIFRVFVNLSNFPQVSM